MTDVLNGLVNEAKKNKFSIIGSDLTDADVCSVWNNVSEFIEKTMVQQKGVSIPGFGTFTLTQKKLEVGNNKFLLIQRPVFAVSEKFAQTHGLNYTKYHLTGQVPVVSLNYSALAFESPFSRDAVESCVREVVLAINRSLAQKRNVEFAFAGVGRLTIRDHKVKMKFFKEFVNQMDGSGKLVDALQGRPGTVDSVMSERAPSRPHTGNTLVLPRIQDMDAQCKGMPPIDEEREYQDPDIARLEDIPLETVNEECEGHIPETDDQHINPEETEYPYLDEHGNEVDPQLKKPTPPPTAGSYGRSASRAMVPLAKATGVSFAEDFMPSYSPKPSSRMSQVAKSSPNPLTRRSLSPLPATPAVPSELGRPRTTDDAEGRGSGDRLNPLKMPVPPNRTPPGTANSCGHANAGQELCYLCHQRARRNIPVSFTEERRKRELEEDKLLQQYQHMQATEHILKEQERAFTKRHDGQRVAAFNLGVAEAVKEKKLSRDTEFYPSYVFQKRPLTPPRFLKQEKYFHDLASQVNSKEDGRRKMKADEEFLERLEQVQLAEDLAAQREQYLKDKREQVDQYKRALSAQLKMKYGYCQKLCRQPCPIHAQKKHLPPINPQPDVRIVKAKSLPDLVKFEKAKRPREERNYDIFSMKFKPVPIPARVPDSEGVVFGVNDLTAEKAFEKRRKAHELYKEQLSTVEQKRREAILKRLQEQKEESDVLKKVRKDLIEDRSDRYERMFVNRKRLEGEWMKAKDLKKGKDAEEKERMRSAGGLLHEQCDDYRRCNQCKRKLPNCGETNIWKESHYIPGSRIMV